MGAASAEHAAMPVLATWAKKTWPEDTDVGNQGMQQYGMPREQKALYTLLLFVCVWSDALKAAHKPRGWVAARYRKRSHRPVVLGPGVAGKGPWNPATAAAEMFMPCSTRGGCLVSGVVEPRSHARMSRAVAASMTGFAGSAASSMVTATLAAACSHLRAG